jgi:hypothetical protein
MISRNAADYIMKYLYHYPYSGRLEDTAIDLSWRVPTCPYSEVLQYRTRLTLDRSGAIFVQMEQMSDWSGFQRKFFRNFFLLKTTQNVRPNDLDIDDFYRPLELKNSRV